MNVQQLIDYLMEQPPDAEIELVWVQPVEDDDEAITVDRFSVDAMLLWINTDDEEGRPFRAGIDDEERENLSVWLVGGEGPDIESMLDEMDRLAGEPDLE